MHVCYFIYLYINLGTKDNQPKGFSRFMNLGGDNQPRGHIWKVTIINFHQQYSSICHHKKREIVKISLL